MKFNEKVNQILTKYPLNEDFGNLFGSLGNFVKKHAKEIIAPMTDPFKGIARKTDLSQGDGILEQVRKTLIKTPEVFNKKLYFLSKGKPVYYDQNKNILPVSYKELFGEAGLDVFTDKEKLDFYNKPVKDKTGKPVFETKNVKPIIKEIIKYVDLNSYNLIDKNKSLLLQKIQEIFQKRKEKQKEYGEEKDPLKSDMTPERVYKRFLYLAKNEIFVTKAKDEDEKTEWLYILAKSNDKFNYTGSLPQAEKEEKEENDKSQQTQQQQQNKPKTTQQQKPTTPVYKPKPAATSARTPVAKPNITSPTAPRTNLPPPKPKNP